MKLFKAAPAVLGMAFLGAAFSPSAKADDNNHKTIVTFSGPVEIPPVYITGMRILPAGTYVFKLTTSTSNRHIVQIFNKAETKIYATVLAIPDYRIRPKGKTVITFNEGIAGAPQPIDTDTRQQRGHELHHDAEPRVRPEHWHDVIQKRGGPHEGERSDRALG